MLYLVKFKEWEEVNVTSRISANSSSRNPISNSQFSEISPPFLRENDIYKIVKKKKIASGKIF